MKKIITLKEVNEIKGCHIFCFFSAFLQFFVKKNLANEKGEKYD